MSDTDVKPAVAPLSTVLGALQDPIRLEMVRRLGTAGEPQRCSALYDSISKSTAAHHFKILREAGLTDRESVDGQTFVRLRTAEIGAALPGLLEAVLEAANRSSDTTDK
ncbi:helix-turn-helix transcriptional regulator [Nocardia otitidiscaviarum]|uniref:Helix-turn-helix domain n=1 Tax=Nocardia otitidiscaviarum TaxID=1823 RepID=A0A378YSU1_9NOCA|nr:helix-turn-helix transcriptional regulator [Nocardia otitidiscaviarum]MBF6132577.1 helix-turn-helix transcriptional regulator [Nocardia otitidiscaviarum]MBF6183437.1 helix-turn-helix transcriptional regulator [Nocardia otitidiscaviarum]MBF6488678.1 helix-turn-helix transcriptional regulator [Nocardia otitidiscaviarum]MCP9624019.1 ArsR family transcriptional regulator [Nocardia otitidiscaviarum]QDP80713.1 helix-turn-helix transcriptional regulator [Nocardia otitidiscaviarum]